MSPEAPEAQYPSNSPAQALGSLRAQLLLAVCSVESTRRIVFRATVLRTVSMPVAFNTSNLETRNVALLISKMPFGGSIDI